MSRLGFKVCVGILPKDTSLVGYGYGKIGDFQRLFPEVVERTLKPQPSAPSPTSEDAEDFADGGAGSWAAKRVCQKVSSLSPKPQGCQRASGR